MKIHTKIILIASLVIMRNHVNAQAGYVTGQLNNMYVYTGSDELDTIGKIFTGISTEIGYESLGFAYGLRTAIFIPKTIEFEDYKEDDALYFYDYVPVTQRQTIYELGIYGKFYPFTYEDDFFRVNLNSGFVMEWVFAKDNYTLYKEPIEEKFHNNEIFYLFGLGFDFLLAENLILTNDITGKFPFSDFDSNGSVGRDPLSSLLINFNIGVKFFLE